MLPSKRGGEILATGIEKTGFVLNDFKISLRRKQKCNKNSKIVFLH
jgi:hypothetical protein